ncbi:hypothetical protein [Myroides odoratimimus]|uniref:hypothetical protein n=1 Tax=Myroides odoratimimus TaxID=76832 RepID=UPI0031015514
MKKIYTAILALLSLFLSIDTVSGQVIIGKPGIPAPGSILQLQNLETNQTDLENANKGLLLPRVFLTDVNNLYPMFSAGYNKTELDSAHSGLMVFNTNDNLFNGDGNGVYHWNGSNWSGLGLIPRTINIYPKTVYLTKNKTSGTAEITPSEPGLQWDETVSGLEDSSTMTSSSSGNTTTMTFNRSNTVFGNKTYTFTLKNNPDRATELQVANLELVINSPLLKVGVGPEDGLVTSKNAVSVYGGQEKWEILSYSKDVFNWDIPPKLEDGKLIFQLGTAKEEGNVDGQITVAHVDDHNLTGTITVRQNSEFVRLPDFDYILLSVYAEDSDPNGGNNNSYIHICISSELRGTGNEEVDDQFVGYRKKRLYDIEYVDYRSASTNADPNKKVPFLYSSGTHKGSTRTEYALLHMNTLTKDILTSKNNREFQFQTRASWYWPEYRANKDDQNRVTVTFRFFKGGAIYFDNHRPQISPDAVEVRDPFVKKGVHVRKYAGKDDLTKKEDREKYTQPLYQVEYDLIENAGIFTPML